MLRAAGMRRMSSRSTAAYRFIGATGEENHSTQTVMSRPASWYPALRQQGVWQSDRATVSRFPSSFPTSASSGAPDAEEDAARTGFQSGRTPDTDFPFGRKTEKISARGTWKVSEIVCGTRSSWKHRRSCQSFTPGSPFRGSSAQSAPCPPRSISNAIPFDSVLISPLQNPIHIHCHCGGSNQAEARGGCAADSVHSCP